MHKIDNLVVNEGISKGSREILRSVTGNFCFEIGL